MSFEQAGAQPFRKHFETHITGLVHPEPLHKDASKEHPVDPAEGEMVDKEFSPDKSRKPDSLRDHLASGRYMDIVEFLRSDHSREASFQKEVRRIRQTPELESADFLTEKDWGIMTALELKDRKTFEHSVGTYLILKEKIEKKIPQLIGWIEQEGIGIGQLYRACLLHDVGKLAIHDSVLKNTTSDHEWSQIFTSLSPEEQADALEKDHVVIPPEIRDDPQEIVSFFSEQGVRASQMVPFEKVLAEKQIAELKAAGIDPSLPIGSIMEIHEQRSGEILRELGFEKEAELAENHHNYKKIHAIENRYPTSQTSLHISSEFAAQMIQLADVQQALQSNRYYLMQKPLLKILASLVDHALKGLIDPVITALWVKDGVETMNPEYLREIRLSRAKHQPHEYVESRRRELEFIEDFMDEYLAAQQAEYPLAA